MAYTSNDCVELKNLKYKTMLLHGNNVPEIKSHESISSLDKFLEMEKKNNEAENWVKMNKTGQTKKIVEFIESYSVENKLNDEEKDNLSVFLKDALDKKKLKKVKDVVYDKENEIIKSIPALYYNKANKHFTLKNADKRLNTLRSLPKKFNSTIKNKAKVSDNSDDR